MKTVYIFGDSLLRGVMPDENGMYHSTDSIDFDGIAKKHDIVIKNYSMPTFTSKQGREWMNRTLEINEKPDLAIVEYGGNDCDFRWSELAKADETVTDPHRVSLEEFEQVYGGILDDLSLRGIRAVVTLCPPLPSHIYLKHLSDSGIPENIIQKYAVSDEIFLSEYVKYKKVILKLAEKKQISALNIEKTFAILDNMVEYYSADGLHPNERGYHLIHKAFDEFFDDIIW